MADPRDNVVDLPTRGDDLLRCRGVARVVVSEAFAADCRQAADWMREAQALLVRLDADARPANWADDDDDPDLAAAWLALDAFLGWERVDG